MLILPDGTPAASTSGSTALSKAPLPHDRRFRPDIEGLRACAILPILFMHAGISILHGGFMGVDVFFVISGFLITRIVQDEIEAGRFSLTGFYHRRAARILPALLAMMLVVTGAACTLLLPGELRDYGRSMAASGGFWTNIYFFRSSDYFAQISDTKPLIHLWSLAVEEQFYLLAPLALWGISRLPRAPLRLMLSGLALASLAYGAWCSQTDTQGAYYLLPSRGWELLGGALAGMGALPIELSARQREILAGLALAVLPVAMVLINNSMPFPVPAAIPVVGATCLLLAYGEGTKAAALLSLSPVRFFGRISYSLYLVHRPVIGLYELLHGITLRLPESLGLIAVCIALGWLFWRLIEMPGQRLARRLPARVALPASLGALLAVMGLGWSIAARADHITNLSPAARQAATYLGYDRTAPGRRQFDTDRCFMMPTGPAIDVGHCLSFAPGQPNILLMGDSHAAQFSLALRQHFAGAHLIQATAAGCRPLLHGKGLPRCRGLVQATLGRPDLSRMALIVLAGRWLPQEVPDLIETARYLGGRAHQVVVVGPMVEYDVDLPRLLTLSLMRKDPSLPQGFVLHDRIILDKSVAQALRGLPVIYQSMAARECGLEGGPCRTVTANNVPMHFDHSHLTQSAARDVVAGMPALAVDEAGQMAGSHQ